MHQLQYVVENVTGEEIICNPMLTSLTEYKEFVILWKKNPTWIQTFLILIILKQVQLSWLNENNYQKETSFNRSNVQKSVYIQCK
jgi:hypothetical protein